MKTSSGRICLLSGSHHPDLARQIADNLGITLDPTPVTRFANGEVHCELRQSVQDATVFVLQTHSADVNDAIMEQAIIIDAAKRAAARRIVAVCPYFGYSRQDRTGPERAPITAKLVTDILTTAGANEIMSIDLHSEQIQGFFDGPFTHLSALKVIADALSEKLEDDAIIVAPDAGRVKLAEHYARHLGKELAVIHKRRLAGGNAAEALNLMGVVGGRQCVIIDDMIDGAGTMCAAAVQLERHGARSILAAATHGIFSDGAAERLAGSPVEKLFVTDSLPVHLKAKRPPVEVISISGLLAGAIGSYQLA